MILHGLSHISIHDIHICYVLYIDYLPLPNVQLKVILFSDGRCMLVYMLVKTYVFMQCNVRLLFRKIRLLQQMISSILGFTNENLLNIV